MIVKQREIHLVPFPFSDFSGRKIRPVLILSTDAYNNSEDVLVCAITTNVGKEKYSVLLTEHDLEEGSLRNPSLVRAEAIVHLHQKLLLKKIGRINHAAFSLVLQEIERILKG